MTHAGEPRPDGPGRITRRHLLEIGTKGALVLGGGAGLAACGGGGSDKAGSTSATGTPAQGTATHGGTLKIGMITAGDSETINPAKVVNVADLLRIAQIYDYLFGVGEDVKTLLPKLALSAEPNKDATLWTLKLRDGVTWHDGSPFTADDVVYTFNSWADPKSNAHGQVAGLVDFKKVRKRDDLTVEVPLLSPIAEFPSLLTFSAQVVVKNGSTTADVATKPVGTGPFKFVSFTPGQRSVFSRNADYWEKGKPYVDSMVVDSSFADEEARSNAILSGAINVAPFLPPLIAKTQAKSTEVNLLNSPSVVQYYFFMRVDKGPFADARVRQALKLIADRPALIRGALSGYGEVGNDLVGVKTQNFASDFPQRQQDIEQAKSLLKAAGQSDLSFVLPTCSALPGFNPSATLFAQQAAKAGVKVDVKIVSPNTYYTPTGGFLRRPIGLDYGAPFQSLTEVYRLFFQSSSPFNETFWGKQDGGAAKLKLIDEAIAATDPARARDLWGEAQRQQYDEGGTIAWANSNDVSAAAKTVRGLKATAAGYLNNFRFTDAQVVQQ
jgi:peptide/nickel transport system substrate-binding protein